MVKGSGGLLLGATGARPWQSTNYRTPPPTMQNSASLGPLPVEAPDADLKRQARWVRRRVMRRVSKVRRMTACGRSVRHGVAGVHRVEGDDGSRGSVAGVMVCGSIWSCPVCSAHIRAARARELADAIAKHHGRGGSLLMVVLTLRHHRGELLDDLVDGLQAALSATFRGAPWARWRDRLGILGRVTTREVTWGGDNGWHPHANLLMFLERPLTAAEAEEFDLWLSERWRSMVVRQGLQEPNDRRGCVLEVVGNDEAAGIYVGKLQESMSVPLEMTWVEAKRSGGLMPFDILDAAGDGEAEALSLWWEYEAATHGRQCMTWSPGLRDRLELGEEQTEEEIVAEHETSEETLLVTLTARDWHAVCDAGLDLEVVRAAEHPLGREVAREAVLAVVDEARRVTDNGRRRHAWRQWRW